MKDHDQIQNYIDILSSKKKAQQKKKLEYEQYFNSSTGCDTSSYDKKIAELQASINSLKWVIS